MTVVLFVLPPAAAPSVPVMFIPDDEVSLVPCAKARLDYAPRHESY